MQTDPAQLRILHFPAAVLRQRAAPIERIDQSIKDLADRMIELMHDAEGLGLAAPQVGVPVRLFVAHVPQDSEPVRVYINPELSHLTDELEAREEGCLSLPGINVQVRRPTGATITATDLEGKPFTFSSTGLLARVWQHEIDHLDGVLFIDRVDAVTRDRIKRRIKKQGFAADAAAHRAFAL
jgi:peptide deformylase